MQGLAVYFPHILFFLMLATGIVSALEKFYWLKKRKTQASILLAEFELRNPRVDAEYKSQYEESLLRPKAWVEGVVSFFPIIALIFLLRSFLFEPFKIPSGSMLPTLHIGDYILVNKYIYGLRLPILNHKIIDLGKPQRGDIMVFKWPKDTSKDFIKRVVGLPGDKISYRNKKLVVNGQIASYSLDKELMDQETNIVYLRQYKEKIFDFEYKVLNNDNVASRVSSLVYDFPFYSNCEYDAQGISCMVPEEHYFVMGDNRDDSEDSRYWGFVPEQNVVGKAQFIWMNFGDMNRVGLI